jgi:chromosome segregation ATPase
MTQKATLLLLFCFSFVFAPGILCEERVNTESITLSQQAMNELNRSLNQLETNYLKQKELLTSLNQELLTANYSLTELQKIYGEQVILVQKLRIWTDQLGERLSESDQSLAWAMEDAALMEEELTRERSNSARLDRSARVWRTVAIVAGVLALGAGVAAVVW